MTRAERLLNEIKLTHPKRIVEVPDVGRETLAEVFALLGFKAGVEIGIESGAYSEVLLRSNPALHLTCVDAWAPYSGYRDHVTVAKLESLLAQTRERLAGLNYSIIRDWSTEAAKQVPNGSMDFVYIDANHDLPHVIEDLAAWVPKVKKTGIIAGHDYVRRSNPKDSVHVVEALNAWFDAYQLKSTLFILGNKSIVPGELRDTPRSWMWVNPNCCKEKS